MPDTQNVVATALDDKTAAARAALPPDLQAIFDKATQPPTPTTVLTVVPATTPAPAPQPTPVSVLAPATPDQSQKADAGKSDPRLVEVDLSAAIEVVNRVLDYGVVKYGQRCGWKRVDMDRYDAAARRHRRARDKGELVDGESGLLHMAHEITNLLFQLQTYVAARPDDDFLTFHMPPAATP